MSHDSVPLTPAERIEDAYLDAMAAIADVIGIAQDDADYFGVTKPPGVDLDAIPMSAVNAGRAALKYLAVGAGILDGQGDEEPSALDADEVLAMWAGGQGA